MADVNYKVNLDGVPFHIVSVGHGITGHIKMHVHSITSYEIHYVESGEGILRLRSGEHGLKKGTFYLTGPGVAHEQITVSREPMEELVLYYTVPLSCRAQPQREDWMECLLDQRFWIGDDAGEVSDILRGIIRETERRPAGFQAMIPHLAGQLFITLGRMYRAGQPEQGEVYMPCSDEGKYLQIERMFLDDPVHITIHGLAEALGLSVRQVQRLMKSHYGITFRQMQMDNKLELACRLLEDTHDSVEKIAEKTGFSAADYFGYCFKKKYGMSPGKFRKEAGQRPWITEE